MRVVQGPHFMPSLHPQGKELLLLPVALCVLLLDEPVTAGAQQHLTLSRTQQPHSTARSELLWEYDLTTLATDTLASSMHTLMPGVRSSIRVLGGPSGVLAA